MAYNLDDAKVLQEWIATWLVTRLVGHDPDLLTPPHFVLQPLKLWDLDAPHDCGKKWNQKCIYDLRKHCCDKKLKQGLQPFPCPASQHLLGFCAATQ